MAKKFKTTPAEPAFFGEFLFLLGVSPEEFVAAVWTAAREIGAPLTRWQMDVLSGNIKPSKKCPKQAPAFRAAEAAGFSVLIEPAPALTGGSRKNVLIIKKGEVF